MKNDKIVKILIPKKIWRSITKVKQYVKKYLKKRNITLYRYIVYVSETMSSDFKKYYIVASCRLKKECYPQQLENYYRSLK